MEKAARNREGGSERQGVTPSWEGESEGLGGALEWGRGEGRGSKVTGFGAGHSPAGRRG